MTRPFPLSIGNVVFTRFEPFECRHCRRTLQTISKNQRCCDQRECRAAERLRVKAQNSAAQKRRKARERCSEPAPPLRSPATPRTSRTP